MRIENYRHLEKYLDGLGLFHMDLTLDRMERFWESSGMPDLPVVHVVGTNGKGSTAAFFASLARAHGLKVGVFTSPHFLTMRERVQINRAMLSQARWVELANAILSAPAGAELTYFEFQTCLAMLAFRQERVDVAVMEAGLGGRFDATNVFAPELVLYTPIGMDHEKVLGDTLAAIARDKAGALRAGSCGVTGPQDPDALLELENRAEAVGARLMYAVDMAEPVAARRLGIPGIHQTVNARLALAGWRWFAAGHDLKSETDKEIFGLETAFLPGRFQRVDVDGREVILDGAHNPHALAALKAALAASGSEPGCVIFSCMEDKDLDAMVPMVRDLTPGPVLAVPMAYDRACRTERLAETFGEKAVVLDSLEAALAEGSKYSSPTLICGSLYLLADFYTLYPHFLTA
nr:cyanophycin synthetase [Pseudodesulfovibrio portus]